jgi:hypothetical protein
MGIGRRVAGRVLGGWEYPAGVAGYCQAAMISYISILFPK